MMKFQVNNSKINLNKLQKNKENKIIFKIVVRILKRKRVL